MKKEYISPRITVMEMESAAILAGSVSSTEPQISVNNDWADEDDEVL